MKEKKASLKRRKFLSAGLAGLAAAAASPYCSRKRNGQAAATEKGERPLIYRTLGRTGIRLPVIGLGTMEATSEALLRTALDAGITHIATNRYYLRGKVEQFVGNIIKSYRREDIILATGVDPRPMDVRTGTFSEKTDLLQYEKDLDVSLNRLDVDYIDILYLPYVTGKQSVTFEPLMRTMERIKREGKVRFLGIASHSSMADALRAAADTGFYDVAMLAYNFRFRDIDDINASIAYAVSKGMGIVAMKTITGTSRMLDSGVEIADNPKAALKWVLQNENIHSTVPGVTNFDQVETNLSVMEDLTLTPEEKRYLEIARMNPSAGYFCQGCGTCLRQCPAAPDIPTLMRCTMYTYGYRDLALALRTMESVKDDPVACAGCPSCVVTCPMGFDIKKKVMDIIRLRNVPADWIC